MNGFERSERLSDRTVDIAMAVGIAMTLLPFSVVAAALLSAPGLALLPFAIYSFAAPNEPH